MIWTTYHFPWFKINRSCQMIRIFHLHNEFLSVCGKILRDTCCSGRLDVWIVNFLAFWKKSKIFSFLIFFLLQISYYAVLWTQPFNLVGANFPIFTGINHGILGLRFIICRQYLDFRESFRVTRSLQHHEFSHGRAPWRSCISCAGKILSFLTK